MAVSRPALNLLPPLVQEWIDQLLPQSRLIVEGEDQARSLVLVTDDVALLASLNYLSAHWVWICRTSARELQPYQWMKFRFGSHVVLAVRPAWASLNGNAQLLESPPGVAALKMMPNRGYF